MARKILAWGVLKAPGLEKGSGSSCGVRLVCQRCVCVTVTHRITSPRRAPHLLGAIRADAVGWA